MLDETRILDRQSMAAGTLVMKEGEFGNRAFYIEKGRVEVFRHDKQGRKMVLAVLGPGSIIGEMALITNERRTASVQALDDCVLVSISYKLQKALSKSDKVFKALIEILAERLNKSNDALCKKYQDISELEEAARLTVQNISFALPEEQHQEFKKDVLPILSELKETLKKYQITKL